MRTLGRLWLFLAIVGGAGILTTPVVADSCQAGGGGPYCSGEVCCAGENWCSNDPDTCEAFACSQGGVCL